MPGMSRRSSLQPHSTLNWKTAGYLERPGETNDSLRVPHLGLPDRNTWNCCSGGQIPHKQDRDLEDNSFSHGSRNNFDEGRQGLQARTHWTRLKNSRCARLPENLGPINAERHAIRVNQTRCQPNRISKSVSFFGPKAEVQIFLPSIKTATYIRLTLSQRIFLLLASGRGCRCRG
jgi:hypothetical protein